MTRSACLSHMPVSNVPYHISCQIVKQNVYRIFFTTFLNTIESIYTC